jgi:F0F1-type ATP synthase delta subunit
MKEAKVIAETMINFWKEKKYNLIEKILEGLKENGKIFLIKEIIDYLKIKKEEMKGFEPAKLFLAFDYDENKIERYLEDNFNLKTKVIKKSLDPELILGGRLLTKDLLVDFSLKRLLSKLLKWKT